MSHYAAATGRFFFCFSLFAATRQKARFFEIFGNSFFETRNAVETRLPGRVSEMSFTTGSAAVCGTRNWKLKKKSG